MNTDVLDVSTRTARKILKRANANRCSVCGWDKAACDIHHIVERKYGGTNNLDNLVILCPNCHRSVHEHGDSFITSNALRKLSLKYVLPNWFDYYERKPSSSYGPKGNCEVCAKHLKRHSDRFCSHECNDIHRQRAEWSYELLDEALTTHQGNMVKVGKQFGVSDNAVRKQCKKFGIDFKQYKRAAATMAV